MTLMFGLMAVRAGDRDDVSYRYRIFQSVKPDERWIVQAKNGFFDCEATLKCVGLDEAMPIRSHKPTWHDPLVIFYVVEKRVRSCELKRCRTVPELTYSDLKSR